MLSSLLVVGVIDVGLCGDHSSLAFVVVVGDAVQVLAMVVDRHRSSFNIGVMKHHCCWLFSSSVRVHIGGGITLVISLVVVVALVVDTGIGGGCSHHRRRCPCCRQ